VLCHDSSSGMNVDAAATVAVTIGSNSAQTVSTSDFRVMAAGMYCVVFAERREGCRISGKPWSGSWVGWVRRPGEGRHRWQVMGPSRW
jgi:hypothetical protein